MDQLHTHFKHARSNSLHREVLLVGKHHAQNNNILVHVETLMKFQLYDVKPSSHISNLQKVALKLLHFPTQRTESNFQVGSLFQLRKYLIGEHGLVHD
jgi:hypothetical protein